MIRVLALVLGAVVGLTGPPLVASPAGWSVGGRDVAPAAISYRPPIGPPFRVVRAFAPPPTPYAAGHRGVDLATHSGALVRAAGPGVVSFAGPVAGRGVVVILHPDGVRTEYEPLAPLVSRGTAVARGQPVGTVAGRHGACAPGGCLHWGTRRDGAYFDPLSLLRPLGPVRLLPWDPAEDP